MKRIFTLSVLLFSVIRLSYAQPTIQASNIVISPVSGATNSLRFDWTNGSGGTGNNYRIVLIYAAGATYTPANGVAAPTASSSFTSGSSLGGGSGNVRCVYRGTGTNVIVTDINPGAEYTIRIYEYNASSADNAGTTYLLSEGLNNPITFKVYTASDEFTVPASISKLKAQVWGAGGGGGNSANSSGDPGGGGGGGAYSETASYSVIPGATYDIEVGNGGNGAPSNSTTAAQSGEDSWFDSNSGVMAKGGSGGANNAPTNTGGGAGGNEASGVGTIRRSGGNGRGTVNSGGQFGGGGGSSAGVLANGTNGSGTDGAAASAPQGGGNGGGSGSGGGGGIHGMDGAIPGGGGGGSDDNANARGGKGADGLVIISYMSSPISATITRKTPATATTSASNVVFTITFSRSVKNVSTSDFALSGTATGNIASVSSTTGTSIDVTVNSVVGDGDNLNLDLSASQDIQDNLNNAFNGIITAEEEYTIDNVGPSVTINKAASQADPINAGPILFTVVFSEPIDESTFDESDIVLSASTTGGTLTPTITEVAPMNNTTYQVSVALTGGAATGNVVASLAADAVQDLLGNDSEASTSTDNSVLYDITAPTATINQKGSQTDPTNASPIVFTVTFSEPINASTFTDVDINLSASTTGGTLTPTITEVAPMDQTTYEVSVALGGASSGQVIASLNANTVQDLAGNNSAASTSTDNTIEYDVTPPTVTINKKGSQDDPTNASPVVFVVQFSEPINDASFTDSDIDLSSGTTGGTLTPTITEVGAMDKTEFEVSVAITGSPVNGNIIASISASAVQDPAGNNNTVSTSTDNSVEYDIAGPSVTINKAASQADPINVGPILFTVVFSEPIDESTFDESDIVLSASTTGGTLTPTITEVAPMNNTTYQVSVALTGGAATGNVVATLAANAVQDLLGNDSEASTSTDNSVLYDITAPTVTINQKGSQTDPTNASPIVFTVTFSEPINASTFTDVDINLSASTTGGTLTPTITEVAPMDQTTYEVSVALGGASSGQVIASLNANTVQDLAGNNSAASTSTDNTIEYDVTPPTVTINKKGSQDDPTNASPVVFVVQFSEPINDASFTDSDIDLSSSTTGGTLTPTITEVGAMDKTEFEVSVAITGSPVNGNIIASINASAIQDPAGNNNTVSTSTDNSVEYDIAGPSVTINKAASQVDPINAGPILFTVVFSEPIDESTFDESDIILSASTTGGTLTPTITEVAPMNNTTYQVSVALTGGATTGNVVATLAANAVQDLLGNDSEASTSTDNSIFYDITAPLGNTVGAVAATGGRTVSGFYNSTNDGVDIVIPIHQADATLDGGTIQVKVQNTQSTGYVDIAGSGTHTIVSADRASATLTLSIDALDLEGAVAGAQGFAEGVSGDAVAEARKIQFTVDVTDLAGNTTTYTSSSSLLDVDQTSPTISTDFRLYPGKGIQNANREVVIFQLSEELYDNSGQVSDNTILANTNKNYGSSGFSIGDPGAGGNDVETNYIRYENDGGANAADPATVTNNKLLWLESNSNNSNWSATASPVTRVQYVPFGNSSSATELIRDAAGNELATIPGTAVVNGDLIPPSIVGNLMTLYPRAGNPEKIVFQLSEPLSTPTTTNGVTGFTTTGILPDGSIGEATYSEASAGACPCTITLTSASDGLWTAATQVSYITGNGNVFDAASDPNELGENTPVTNNPLTVETTAPSISSVTIPDVPMKVGSVVTVEITTADDDGDDPIFFGTPTIGGYTLTSLTSVSSTSKQATFEITEGGASFAAGANIPVSITFQDLQGNTSTTYATAIAQSGDPIDATSPTIVSITNSTSTIFEGSLTQTVTVEYSEPMSTGTQPVITINGGGTNWGSQTPVGGTNGWVDDTYTASFTHNGTQQTITGITTSVAIGGANDAAGNGNLGNATSTSFNLDTQKPTVSTITLNPSVVTISDNVLRVTVTYSEDMKTSVAPTLSFSTSLGNLSTGVPVDDATFTNGWKNTEPNNVYAIEYTHDLTEEELSSLTVSVNGAYDAAGTGNVQTVVGTSGTFRIDTQKPVLTSINRLTPATATTNASSLVFRATFTEDVTGSINYSDFTPVLTGVTISSGNISVVGGSGGTQWDITLNDVEGDGSVGLDLAPLATITDIYGNPLATTIFNGEVYAVDQTAPQPSAIDISSPVKTWASANGTSSEVISWVVKFNENVTGVDAADFQLMRNGASTAPNATLTFDPVLNVTGTDDEWTVTLSDVKLLNFFDEAQLHINLLNDGSIKDIAGNALAAGLSTSVIYGGNDFYTILFPEPSDPPSNLTLVSATPTSLTVSWDQPASPTVAPNYYFYQIKKLTDSDFKPEVTDGSWNGSGLFDLNAGGTLSRTFNYSLDATNNVVNLNSGVTYNVRIISTNYSGYYNGADLLDYLTSSTLDGSFTTKTAESTTITSNNINTTINSIVDESPAGQFTNITTFTIDDDGPQDGDDDAPFKFSQLIITPGASNTITDWTQAIAGAELVPSSGSTVVGSVQFVAGASRIVFAGFDSNGDGTNDNGYIPDNGSKTYTLRIWLKSALGGTLPANIDGMSFDFAMIGNSSNFTFDDGDNQISSRFAASQTASSGAVTVDVTAQGFKFVTQPVPTTHLVLKNFTTTPEVHAVDHNGNLDKSFTGITYNVSVTNADGIAMNPGNSSTMTLTPVAGVITFPSNFQYAAAGNGTLTVSYNTLNSDSPLASTGSVACSAVTVDYSNLSTITAGSGVTRVLSTVTSSVSATPVFMFTYNDDGGIGLGDGADSKITQMVITPDASNELDWAEVIAGATLSDGNDEVMATDISSTGITFNGAGFTSSSLATVTDGAASASKTYTLKVWFKTSLGALAATADQDHLVFAMSTDPANLTLATAGSQAPTAAAQTSGAGNGIFEVDATRLIFSSDFSGALPSSPIPPPPNSGIDFLVNTTSEAQSLADPIVQAVDMYGNRDTDFNGAVTTTAAAGMSLNNALTSLTSGVGTFSNNFSYNAVGDGSLTVSTAVTNRVNAAVSATTNGQSINVKTGTATSINTPSIAAATISSTTNVSPGATVFTFSLTDDPSGTPALQDDGNPTKITDLIFTRSSSNNTINDWSEAIAGARLEDAADPSKYIDIDPADILFNTLTFNGIATASSGDLGWIPDDQTKTFNLRIWLKSDLSGTYNYNNTIDGLKFGFDLLSSNVTTDNTGTNLLAGQNANPTNVSTTVDVTASKLDITVPSTSTYVSINTPFHPVILARDANNNLDLDFDEPVSEITNSEGVSITPAVVGTAFTGGILNFADDIPTFKFTSGDNNDVVTLAVKAGTGTTCGVNAICTSAPGVGVFNPVLTLKTNTITAGPGAEPSTISSLSTTTNVPVFDFSINDDDNQASGTDSNPTQLTKIVITQLTGNDIPDWRDVIAAATLTSGAQSVTVTPNATNLTFNGLSATSPGDIGYIDDNASKVYTLSIRLNSSITGGYASILDNLNLAFEVVASPTNISVAPGSSTFSTSENENSGATNNAIEVIATKLKWTTQPADELLVNKDISLQLPLPVIEALDANGNRDLNYVTNLNITNAGTLSMSGNGQTGVSTFVLNPDGTAPLTGGIYTFPNDFQFDAIGNGTMYAVPAAATTVITTDPERISDPVTVRVGISATIKPGALTEPTEIESWTDLVDRPAGLSVFDFLITDDDGLVATDNQNDGNPTRISSITIKPGTGNTITNWADALQQVSLDDGEGHSVIGGISATSLTFSLTNTQSTDIGYIADGGNKTYTLTIWLKESLGGSLPTTIDGQRFVFDILQSTDVETDINGSAIKSGEVESSGSTNNMVTVEATDLFFINPSSTTSASISVNFTPAGSPVAVEARDENGNRDLDFNDVIDDLSNATNATMSNGPVEGSSLFTSGLYSFPTNFQFISGNNNDNVSLTMNAGTITGTSPLITLSTSLESKIELATTPSVLINYKDYQDVSLNTTNITNSFELARFKLFDGDGSSNDTDGAQTVLTDLTVNLLSHENVRTVALYDGNNMIAGTEKTVASATVVWNGLTISAPDDGTKEFSLRASFSSTVTADNDEVRVSITSATAGTGSKFALPDAGGATTGAGFNKIDVVATKFVFTTDPPAALNYIYTNLATTPVVEAHDALNNLDTDYSATIQIANAVDRQLPLSSTSLSQSGSTISLSMVNGVLTFPVDFRYNDDLTHYPLAGTAANGQLRARSATNAANGSVPSDGFSSNADVIYASSTTIIAGVLSEPATISSLANSTLVSVFDFTIDEDNHGSSANNDGSPTRIEEIVITPSSENDTQFNDWTKIINSAVLVDNDPITPDVAGDISFSASSKITFTLDPSTTGFIADNATKTFTLRITLRSDLDAALQDIVDNRRLGFEVLDDNIDLSPLSSTFTGSESENSGAGTNAINVVATQLTWTVNPTSSILVNKDLGLQQSPLPVIEALDANNNRDLDYTTDLNITNGENLLMTGDGQSANATFVLEADGASAPNGGVYTFPNDFQYKNLGTGNTGNGTLTAVPSVFNSITTASSSSTVTVRVAISGTITAGSTPETPTIASIIDTDAEKIEVFDFTINDDPGLDDDDDENDGNPIQVTQIIITQNPAITTDTISVWTQAIAGAVLTDGTNEISGVIGANTISFNAIPNSSGELGYIADGSLATPSSKTFDLLIYLKKNLGGTLPSRIDGLRFAFEVTASNISTLATGTSIIASENENSGTNGKVTVNATQLDFTTQPDPFNISTFTSISNPFMVVSARDENANLDLNYNGTIGTISNSGTTGTGPANELLMTNLPSGNFVNGIFDFSNYPGFQFEEDSHLEPGQQITLTLPVVTPNSLGVLPTAAVSDPFMVTSSFESSLSFEQTVADPTIDYINYQADDIINDGNSVILETLILTDGDADGDLDGANTILSSFTVSITNPQNIKRVALFDDSGTEIPSTEQLVNGAATVTFSGLSITAVDAGPGVQGLELFTIRATFNDDSNHITDHDLIQLRIVDADLAGGSQFINDANSQTPDPAYIGGILNGALSPEQTIDVTATRLDFTTQPVGAPFIAGKNEPIAPPVIEARDANSVLDLDYDIDNADPAFQSAEISSTAGTSLGSFNFENGKLIFPVVNDGDPLGSSLYYTGSGNGTLTVTANGLSSATGGSLACTPINVVHVNATMIAPGTKGVLGSTNIRGGTLNATIFGVTFKPEHKSGTEPQLTGFSIQFNNPYKTSTSTTIRKFTVLESSTGSIIGATDIAALSGSITEVSSPSAPIGASDMIHVSFSTPRAFSQSDTLSYFLQVDINPTANITTPHLMPMMADLGYLHATNENIRLTVGSATTHTQTGHAADTLKGLSYQFASSRPPKLVYTEPFNGQMNVDPAMTQIELVFDVDVLTFDGKAELYDRKTNALVTTLTASNGQYGGNIRNLSNDVVDTLKFNIPSGVTLLPDNVYYIKIAAGQFTPGSNTGAGIADEGQNFFGGISYNGTLYFKTASPNPPKLTATDVNKYFASNSGGVFNATFDQFGKGYYLILDHDGGIASVNNNAILNPDISALSYVAHGSFNITQVAPNSQSVAFTADLLPDHTYDIWVTAENDALPTPVRTSAPYGAATSFTPGSPGPTLTIKTPKAVDIVNSNKPLIQICPNSTAFVNTPIILGESNVGDFNGGLQDFNILLPTGFAFDVNHTPTVLLSGADFDQLDTVYFVNNTILHISVINTGATDLDNIIITDFKIIASTSGSLANITRFAGSGLTTVSGTLASLYAKPVDDQKFTNSFTTLNQGRFEDAGIDSETVVNVIPNNFPSEVQLIPVIKPETDYGASFFTGPGVTNDVLNLTGVALDNAFDITMSHTDMNGCVSVHSEQYLVYDHTKGIPALGTKAAIVNNNFPALADSIASNEILYDAKAGYKLIELFANLPSEASQIMAGSEWQAIVSKIPKESSQVSENGGLYRNYGWNYAHVLNATSESGNAISINPYDHFKVVEAEGLRTYWRGGSLGIVEFTGRYQNTADLSIIVPFRQEVELFVPPIPVIKVSSNTVTDGGTPVFCEAQVENIQLTGYPLATSGVSTGYFVAYDSATFDPNDLNVGLLYNNRPGIGLPIKEPIGFIDNSNGTATIDPSEFTNNYRTVRIEYTFQENNSPAKGTATFFLRVAPTPVANFIARSEITPKTPADTAYCVGAKISFDANASQIPGGFIPGFDHFSWNFSDPDAESSNPNIIIDDQPTASISQHTFKDDASYNVRLVVTSRFGCESPETSQAIHVGNIPEVNFSFRGVSIADPIVLTSENSDDANGVNTPFRLLWNFGDGNSRIITTNLDDSIHHYYDAPGIYPVKLTVTTARGCTDTTRTEILVLDRAPAPTALQQYFESFEDPNLVGSWQTASLPLRSSEVNRSSWEMKSENGDTWWTTTGAGGVYRSGEKSALYSPSFDLSQLMRPMISFNSLVQLENNDGVVLQYSVDDKNVADPTKEWIVLGSVGDGKSWFTNRDIAASPGSAVTIDNTPIQSFNNLNVGWSGSRSTWTESKHTIANEQGQIINATNVVFRFALAASQQEVDAPGFAIDNFRIGNRTRIVLVENFTNTGNSQQGIRENQNVVIEQYENDKVSKFNPSGTDSSVVVINYHVGFPDQDPFNLDNPQDPGARALYYNISSTPRAQMDGRAPSSDPFFSSWSNDVYDTTSLKLADARIMPEIVTGEDGSSVGVRVKVTAQRDLPANTILHVVVVEKEISISQLNQSMQSLVRTQEDEFHYVMKAMLPNAAGTKFNQKLAASETRTFPGNTDQYVWADLRYYSTDQLAVVIFLQNEDTREVYQSEIINLGTPGVITGIDDKEPIIFSVYPNPADREFTIELPEAVKQRTAIELYDQLGKQMRTTWFEKGEQIKILDTHDFAAGMYLIQVSTEKGVLRRKILITHKN